MLKAFQNLLDLAKASLAQQMPRDRENGLPVDRMSHFKIAFSPRNRFPGKPKAAYKPKDKKESDDKPRLTVRDYGKTLAARGSA